MPEPERMGRGTGSLRKELEVLEQILLKRERGALNAIEIRGAALSLASLYNGMESILKRILTLRGDPVTDHANWHSAILRRASELGIVSETTSADMRAFLGFRHFVRHAYSFEIDPAAIDAVLDRAPELVRRFIAEVEAEE